MEISITRILFWLVTIGIICYFVIWVNRAIILYGKKAIIATLLSLTSISMVIAASLFFFGIWDWDMSDWFGPNFGKVPGTNWWPEEWNCCNFPDPLNIFIACAVLYGMCYFIGMGAGMIGGFLGSILIGLLCVYITLHMIICSNPLLGIIGVGLMAFLIRANWLLILGRLLDKK